MSKKIRFRVPTSTDPKVQKIVDEFVADYFGPEPGYDESLKDHIAEWGLPYFGAGVVIYNEDHKILLMHEGKVQIGRIKDVELRENLLAEGRNPNEWVIGDGGWNLPSGRLNLNEDFEDGAMREAAEESGWEVEMEGHLWTRIGETGGNRYVSPNYLARAISGPEEFSTEETIEIGWFSFDELYVMLEQGLIRIPELVEGTIEALEAHWAKEGGN